MKNKPSLRLLVCSGNLGNEQPDAGSLASWIPRDGQCCQVIRKELPYPIVKPTDDAFEPPVSCEESEQFDIIVIGMQEATFEPSSQLTETEENGSSNSVRVQLPVVEPIRKGLYKTVDKVTALTANRDYTKKKSAFFRINTTDWSGGTKVLHALLESHLPSYQRKVSYQRGQMRLEIFCHADVCVQVLHVDAQNTGRAGLANKGGIVAVLDVMNTRLAFLTSHLEAHEGKAKYNTRINSIADILGGTKLDMLDISVLSHFSFVMGDLNFRTELANGDELSEEEHKQIVRDMVVRKDWKALNKIDELHRALREKDCLVQFQTLFCNFPPTFKLERKSGYEYVDKRRPSYTDRVLWKCNHQLDAKLKPLVYEPIDGFVTSDHKPVRAAFEVELCDPFQMRPRLARQRRPSVMDLAKSFGRKTKIQSRKGKVHAAYKDRLHLFVTQIQCRLEPNGKDATPSAYLCLISYPKELLNSKVTRLDKIRSKILLRSSSVIKKDDTLRTIAGWPRSVQASETWTPVLSDMHCEVFTHEPDGNPAHLTGAQLCLTLMGSSSKGRDDCVLGTCTVNLVNLFRQCERHRGSHSAINPRNRSSVVNFLWRQKEEDRDPSASEEDDPVSSIDIDEPLLLNGREVGRIHCVIDAWWMDSSTARALSSSTIIASNQKSQDLPTSDEFGQRVLLTARHNDHGPNRKKSSPTKDSQ